MKEETKNSYFDKETGQLLLQTAVRMMKKTIIMVNYLLYNGFNYQGSKTQTLLIDL